MPKTKCPICGGSITFEYCESCGFRIPDEKSITSVYDYDPADDDFSEEPQTSSGNSGADAIRVIEPPEVTTAALHEADKAAIPHIEAEQVNDGYNNNANPYADKNPNIYGNTESGSPYTNIPPGSADGNASITSFIRDELFKILLVVFIPWAGGILGILFILQYKDKAAGNPKYTIYGVYMLVLTIIKFVFLRYL